MQSDILVYNQQQTPAHQAVCTRLAELIAAGLPDAENKLWHGHPVWFFDGNPTVGYSHQKDGIRLMFWSGADFDEPLLQPSASGKFKDASIFYNHSSEITADDLRRWLAKSREIQWDYKHLVRNKGILKRLT